MAILPRVAKGLQLTSEVLNVIGSPVDYQDDCERGRIFDFLFVFIVSKGLPN